MPALLANTSAYAAQVLRNKKITNVADRLRKPTSKDLLRQDAVFSDVSTTVTQEGSSVILSARGAFYLVKLSAKYGPGVYAIDELTREVTAPGDASFTRIGATTSPILLTSIEFNQTDITSQIPCLDNAKVFYSFGQNFGQVAITGEVLLGPLGDINYDGVNRLLSFFWKYRVSVHNQPISVSVANNPYFVYLTGLKIGQVNADFHILPFAMFGTLLDINREKASTVNVRGQVLSGGSVSEPSLFKALQQVPKAQEPTQTKPGEQVTPISVTNDPSLFYGPTQDGVEITDSKAGPASDPAANDFRNPGNTPEGRTYMRMLKLKEKDAAELAKLRNGDTKDPAVAARIAKLEDSQATLDTMIEAQKTRVAQAKNLDTKALNNQPEIVDKEAAAKARLLDLRDTELLTPKY